MQSKRDARRQRQRSLRRTRRIMRDNKRLFRIEVVVWRMKIDARERTPSAKLMAQLEAMARELRGRIPARSVDKGGGP